jgi:hypothetical protein
MTYNIEGYVPETPSTIKKVQSIRETAEFEMKEIAKEESYDPDAIHEKILNEALKEGEQALYAANKSLRSLRIIEPNHRYGDVPKFLTEMVNHIEQLKENL